MKNKVGAKKGNKSVKIGTKFKYATKKYLLGKGFQVEYIEKFTSIPTPKGLVRVKRDLFASDILAIDREQIIFVQVKYGSTERSRQVALSSARTEYGKFTFPDFVDKWIFLWQPGVKNPEIIEL